MSTPDAAPPGVRTMAIVRWGLVALILGLPLPFVILAFMPGCNFR